ncbi:hypothetical protein SPI_07733 [Niveomyces insectorum RCEF 264]|uniref:Uncharacterized protein n=1 Tax=Niveomyces insectorum RCEF 264 TaxID=1081102 RepID=A0A167PJM5_9HYPO|nr:hypothetical protein SPI_07733 [Niveomyces insectorum RCEF 264]
MPANSSDGPRRASPLGPGSDLESSGSDQSRFNGRLHDASAPTDVASPGECPTTSATGDAGPNEPLNQAHMELLVHFVFDKDIFRLGDSRDFAIGLPIALKTGLESPYLLHQLLAFSARHQAFLHPERAAAYLQQAVYLQTKAISLFNATGPAVDESNCVAALLFAAALGHHLLADTLSRRDDAGGLPAFLAHYIQCVEMHRGVFVVASAAWPLLLASELEPILSRSAGLTSRSPRGTHCQRLHGLVDGARGLSEADTEACREAIRYLQVGFDAMLAEREELAMRQQMIFSWSLLAAPKLTGLLAARRPEVLVVLAYYALLLHYGRAIWLVGDAGQYIFCLVADYLGPSWEDWLAYPRERMTSEAPSLLDYDDAKEDAVNLI